MYRITASWLVKLVVACRVEMKVNELLYIANFNSQSVRYPFNNEATQASASCECGV